MPRRMTRECILRSKAKTDRHWNQAPPPSVHDMMVAHFDRNAASPSSELDAGGLAHAEVLLSHPSGFAR